MTRGKARGKWGKKNKQIKRLNSENQSAHAAAVGNDGASVRFRKLHQLSADEQLIHIIGHLLLSRTICL